MKHRRVTSEVDDTHCLTFGDTIHQHFPALHGLLNQSRKCLEGLPEHAYTQPTWVGM